MHGAKYERFGHALALFGLGVVVLAHGIAATVFVEGVTPRTVALPLVGSAVAYRSFVGLLPEESLLSTDGVLVVLAALTAGFVNLVGPAVYASATDLPRTVTPPDYWSALVVGVAGFAALAVYELLAARISGRHVPVKLLVAALIGATVGFALLDPQKLSLAQIVSFDALPVIGGALLAVALFDYGRTEG